MAVDIEFLTTLMDNPEIEVNVYLPYFPRSKSQRSSRMSSRLYELENLPGFNITNEFSTKRLGRPI